MTEEPAARDIDIEQALQHPRAVFAEPNDVVDHPKLTRKVKLAILREWEQDARRLSASEGKRPPPLRSWHGGAGGPRACDSPGPSTRETASAWRSRCETPPRSTGSGRPSASARHREPPGLDHHQAVSREPLGVRRAASRFEVPRADGCRAEVGSVGEPI